MKKSIFLLLLLPLFAHPQIPDPMPGTYVNDFANVLSPEQEAVLNDSIRSIEKKSSVQLAIVLVNKLPNGMSIEDYSLNLGRKWHVGNANNGLVYVASIDEHKQRLEVASALQGDVTDSKAEEVMDDTKQYYRQKDYYSGLKALVQNISVALDPALKKQNLLAAQEKEKAHEKQIVNLKTFGVWLGGLVLLLFACLPFYLRRKRKIELKAVETEKEEQKRGNRENDLFNKRMREYNRPNSIVMLPTEYTDTTDYSTKHKSSSNSDDGNWGSGSSSSSSDSGFDGGGASSGW